MVSCLIDWLVVVSDAICQTYLSQCIVTHLNVTLNHCKALLSKLNQLIQIEINCLFVVCLFQLCRLCSNEIIRLAASRWLWAFAPPPPAPQSQWLKVQIQPCQNHAPWKSRVSVLRLQRTPSLCTFKISVARVGVQWRKCSTTLGQGSRQSRSQRRRVSLSITYSKDPLVGFFLWKNCQWLCILVKKSGRYRSRMVIEIMHVDGYLSFSSDGLLN